MRPFLCRISILLLLVLAACGLANAQERAKLVSLEFRSFQFRSASEGTYQSTNLKIDGENGSALYASMSEGDRKTLASGVKTGGYDFEVGIRTKTKELKGTYQLGIGAPRTPAEGGTAITYGVDFETGSKYDLALRGYAGPTSGVGVFASTIFGDLERTSLNVRVGAVVSGQSTVDEVTGQGKRNLLVRASINHQINDLAKISVGVANDLGDTTRFSLNSSVGNAFAFTFGLQVRF